MVCFRRLVFSGLFSACVVSASQAGATWNVSFVDPTNSYSGYYNAIRSNLIAAGNEWGSRLVSQGSIDISIGFQNIGTANGRSVTTVFDHTNNGINVFQQGAGSEFITGIDPNGGAADVEINIGLDWLQNVIWWDPNPTVRTDVIPGNKVDGYSVMLHELGHALAFNGWRNGTTGTLPGNYMSMFDEQVAKSGGYLYFNGANAQSVYGGGVPLTLGNYGHYGNLTGPGSELTGVTLMNGVYTYYQTRWNVSDLDQAILVDSGFTAAPVPEPGTLTVLAVAGLGLLRRRTRKQA